MKAPALSLLATLAAWPAGAAIWDEPTFGLCAADEYRRGVYVYTDYVFDDRGADTNGSPGGDFTYPSAEIPYRNDAADLVEVRIRPDAAEGRIEIGVRLNTLYFEDVPVSAIAIDDGTAGELREEWPHRVGLVAEGARWVVTLRKDGAALVDLSTGATTALAIEIRNDTPPAERHLENTLTASIPLADLGLSEVPQTGQWKLWAAAGLWEGSGWARPGGEDAPGAYDLAFVADEAFTNWQQNVQAEILAGGDVTRAAGVLDFGAFPDRPAPVESGRFTRIYRSRIETLVGEGRGTWTLRAIGGLEGTVAAPLGDDLLGLFLPYAIWIPEGYDSTPFPLFFELHGFLGNHLGLGSFANGTIDVPALAYSPSGRAGSNFYLAEGEVDVMEGFEDVKAHYAVNEDRVYLSGISMGGFGTYKIAIRYPDLFAAAVPLIGTAASEESLTPEAADGIVAERVYSKTMAAGQREMLENVLNVPFRIFNGQIDWLVNNGFAQGDVLRFEELGYDYQYSGFTKRHHEIVPEYTNVLYHQVLDGCRPPFEGCDPALDPEGGFIRDRDPARVVYEIEPFHFFAEIGLVYAGAYWVSEMKVRDASRESSFGKIDATSRALAAKLGGATERIGPELRFFAPTIDPYHFQGIRRVSSGDTDANEIEAALTNLGHAALDLGRMGIDVTAFRARISGDGAAELSLLGPFTAGETVTVLRDGAPFTGYVVREGRIILQSTFAAPSTFDIMR